MEALQGAVCARLASREGVARSHLKVMLLDLRCCRNQFPVSGLKNVDPSSFQAKLDASSSGTQPYAHSPLEDPLTLNLGSGGGSNVGNGGNGGSGGKGGSPDFQGGKLFSACALHEGETEAESEVQIRSFCCLCVDPVLDGSKWKPFSEKSFLGDCWRPCMVPSDLQAEIMWKLVSGARITDSTLAWVKKQIEEWYHSEGYVLAKVIGFSGVESGRICCRISEGKFTDINVLFKDENGNITSGQVHQDIIRRELPRAVREGMPYNKFAIKEAVQRIFQLHLFDKVHADFSISSELGGVTLNFSVQERGQDGCYFQTGLSFISSESGRPILSSVRPAATLSVEHRNIAGMNRTLQGYIHSNDLLSPQDDSRFKLEYVHPYIDSLSSSRDRVFRVSCYNSRKLAAVFVNPRDEAQTPAVWVDRAGLKTSITEKFTKESKLSYGFVVEEVATRDNLGTIQESAGGSGVEHVPFFHAKITRDNTRFVQGCREGAIDAFQVDQGLGLGTKTSFFNKHQLSATRYIPLKFKTQPPFQLAIVRARYGGIVGDSPRYRAFTSGGPYSLRGSNAGELGNCTSFLELMSELRVPVHDGNYAYAYVESFTDLDGFLYHGQNLQGLAKSASNGVLVAIGMKIDGWRTEFVFDCGARTGSVNVQLGERS